MLASGTAVTKGNTVVLDGSKGWIIPKSGKIACGMKEAFKNLVKQFPKEANDMTELYEQKGIYVFDLWLKNGSAEDKVGYKRLIMRSDNEPSIKALKSAVKAAVSGVEVVLEESKTGDSRSNGMIESAVKECKRQCRAMKSALQEHIGAEIDDKHPLLSWVARHGCFLVSRYRLGQDGRTAYERLKGKRWKVERKTVEKADGHVWREDMVQAVEELRDRSQRP
eukprot:s42_g21.t1